MVICRRPVLAHAPGLRRRRGMVAYGPFQNIDDTSIPEHIQYSSASHRLVACWRSSLPSILPRAEAQREPPHFGTSDRRCQKHPSCSLAAVAKRQYTRGILSTSWTTLSSFYDRKEQSRHCSLPGSSSALSGIQA